MTVRFGVLAARAASAGGAFARSRPSRRGREIPSSSDEVLLLLDLLAAGTGAGLSGPMALRAAVDALEGDFAERLTVALARSDIEPDRYAPLRRVAEEVGSHELRRAVAVLERSAALGTPLADRIATAAQHARRARAREAMRRARTAPVRLLFPLVLLVLPAFVLLTVVPMLLLTLGTVL